MVSLKIVMSRKDGKSFQREIKDTEADTFLGKKIGDKVSGEFFGLAGYEFQIMGGSDDSGFPMRKDLDGSLKKKILTVKGIGVKKIGKGTRQRKTVAGNTFHDKSAQVNLKILKEGAEKFVAAAPVEGEKKA